MNETGLRFIVEGKPYDYFPKKMMNVEAMAIEEKAGLTLTQLGQGISAGSVRAMTAVLWIMMKRENPLLRFTEVKFALGDYSTDLICQAGHVIKAVRNPAGQNVPGDCAECGETLGKAPDDVESEHSDT